MCGHKHSYKELGIKIQTIAFLQLSWFLMSNERLKHGSWKVIASSYIVHDKIEVTYSIPLTEQIHFS
jgi:hypothetical protein